MILMVGGRYFLLGDHIQITSTSFVGNSLAALFNSTTFVENIRVLLVISGDIPMMLPLLPGKHICMVKARFPVGFPSKDSKKYNI